jgi:hypothetical protein
MQDYGGAIVSMIINLNNIPTFIEKVNNGTVFNHPLRGDNSRFFSVPDEQIAGVTHIYMQRWAKPDRYDGKFEHEGTLIGGTVYNCGYCLGESAAALGIEVGDLPKIKADLERRLSEQ